LGAQILGVKKSSSKEEQDDSKILAFHIRDANGRFRLIETIRWGDVVEVPACRDANRLSLRAAMAAQKCFTKGG